MWVRCQYKKEYKPAYRELVNLDRCFNVKLDITGNVGRIFAYKENGEERLLGEYRDYAAAKVFEQIGLLMDQKHTYMMPDEQEANEKHRDKEAE